MKEVYLVTGASGHLGNAVVRALLKEDKRVRAMVLPKDPLLNTMDARAEIVFGDVCDAKSMEPCFRTAGDEKLIVVHLAGIVSISKGQYKRIYEVNVSGTKNVVALCEAHGVEKLVYVSSVHAIPEKPHGEVISETEHFDPALVVGDYAKTKAEATAFVQEAQKRGLNASIVHPSGIIGPYDCGCSHMTQLILDYAKGRLWACVRGGYDFVDVRDVADGILACIRLGKSGECYILSNRYIEVAELLLTLRKVMNGRRIRFIFPFWFIRLVAPLAEGYCRWRKQKPLFTAYSMMTLQSNSYFSHEKAQKELGYTPRSIEQTLSDTVEWLREQGRI